MSQNNAFFNMTYRHHSSNKWDNTFSKIFWVTNENSVHKCQGYDSGCLVSYFNFMNISLNSVYMFALRLQSLRDGFLAYYTYPDTEYMFLRLSPRIFHIHTRY